ncbi:MAG: hypothetical protein AB8V79_05360 [Candidatus Midichloria sp.]|nr:glutamate--cysteine ligase [Hyalomma marginatum]
MLPTQAMMSADLNSLNSVIKSNLSQIQDWIEEKRGGPETGQFTILWI